MKPTIGRIVHYVYNSIHLAAIITYVYSDVCVNLTIFNADPFNALEVVFVTTSVVYDESKQERTWHWPERES